MIKKFSKLFLVLGVILFIFCTGGCSPKNSGDTSSFIHIDYFYGKKDDVLIDNKITIGIGNSLFNENDEKILSIDDDYYQGISNISISVFIDNGVEPKNKIDISTTDFFSNKYIVDVGKNKTNVDDYKKTFVFNLSDYEINSVIKFVLSYEWMYQENITYHAKELFLYGSFLNGNFIISKEKNVNKM